MPSRPAIPDRRRDLRARTRSSGGSDVGFTLVELLVVVVVIGILATVAIPSYLAVQAAARDGVLQADLVHAKTATLGWAAERAATATLPAIDTGLTAWGYTPSRYSGSGAAPSYTTGSTASLFCIVGTSDTGQQYSVTSRGVVRKGFCPFSTSEW